MAKTVLISCLTAALVVLTACGGEVVTTQPTVGTLPTTVSPPTLELTLRPTATAPFLPPAATATPTVTPTPIVHIVREGDTLGAIAFQYEVSVEAIQTANGIENPQFLQIGQELVIPTGEGGADRTSGLLLPTATPLPLVVQGVAFYETPVGSLLCLGEVVNTTESLLTDVQVYVALYDAGGELLVDANAFAYADMIPPGERTPFGVLFTTPPLDWASSQVTIMRGEAAGVLADSYVPIIVAETEGQPSGPEFQVRGIARNASPDQSADSVSVIVTTYDAEGLVTGSRQREVELEGTLAPGSTAPFSVLLSFHGAFPADFAVIALGRIPSEQ